MSPRDGLEVAFAREERELGASDCNPGSGGYPPRESTGEMSSGIEEVRFEFTCGCDTDVQQLVPGSDREFDVRVECVECGTTYAVSITEIVSRYG